MTPFCARGQRLKAFCTAFLAGAAHGKLHYHHRQAQNHQKYQIQQNKGCAAVFACDIRKAPHIAKADGAPRADEQKAQARGKFFTLLHKDTP